MDQHLDDSRLQADIQYLEDALSEVIREQEGGELFHLIEEFENACKRIKDQYDPSIEEFLLRESGKLNLPTSSKLTQAFALYFYLLNTAEENFGMQQRREIQRQQGRLQGSFEDCLARLKDKGVDRQTILGIINDLSIEPVMTAHPTEAKRLTILKKYRKIYLTIFKKENPIWTPEEKALLREDIINEIQKLYRSLRRSIGHFYPDHDLRIPPLLRFGSWVGGDRDGNPNVTPEVTRWTIKTQRDAILSLYIQSVQDLIGSLSHSTTKVNVSEELIASIEADKKGMPDIGQQVLDRNPYEPYRQKLSFVKIRLEKTRADDSVKSPLAPLLKGGDIMGGSYHSPAELLEDLSIIQRSLAANRGMRTAEIEIDGMVKT